MLGVFSSAFVGYIWWESKTDPVGWGLLMFLPFFNFGKLYLDIATLAVGKYSNSMDALIAGPGS